MQKRIDKSGTFIPTIFTIFIDSNLIRFNTTGFYVFFPNGITKTLVYNSNNIDSATYGEKILNFYATITSGQVRFNIDGFESATRYQVRRGDSLKNNTTSVSSGHINLNNSVWNEQYLEIYRYWDQREYYFEVG